MDDDDDNDNSKEVILNPKSKGSDENLNSIWAINKNDSTIFCDNEAFKNETAKFCKSKSLDLAVKIDVNTSTSSTQADNFFSSNVTPTSQGIAISPHFQNNYHNNYYPNCQQENFLNIIVNYLI